MAGTLTLLGSVIVMTLLASIESGFDPDHKSYSTEYKSLFIYDTFLVSSLFSNLMFLFKMLTKF